jgi:RNA polymerase-binding protein DksA
MDRHEMEHFRKVLMGLGRRELTEEDRLRQDALRPAGTAAEGNTETVPGDTGDKSVEQFGQEVSLSLLENERRISEQVADALRRIDAGTFGRCTECGREISAARLKALPYVPYCVDCARRLEGT